MSDLLIGNKKLKNIQLAMTKEEQKKGLMGVEWPPPILVFVYKTPTVAKFWMKKTPSPLDIIFCRNNRIADIFQGKPNDEETFGPDDEIDFVIEAPLGFVAEHNIRIGGKVRVIYSIEDLKRFLAND